MGFTKGDTFVNAAAGSIRPHLWALISDTDQSTDEIVIVNFTTFRSLDCDDTCVIQPHEHGFVVHETCISYADAEITDVKRLRQALDRGLLTPQKRLSVELLQRIRDGAERSPDTPHKVRKVLRAQGLTIFEGDKE